METGAGGGGGMRGRVAGEGRGGSREHGGSRRLGEGSRSTYLDGSDGPDPRDPMARVHSVTDICTPALFIFPFSNLHFFFVDKSNLHCTPTFCSILRIKKMQSLFFSKVKQF